MTTTTKLSVENIFIFLISLRTLNHTSPRSWRLYTSPDFPLKPELPWSHLHSETALNRDEKYSNKDSVRLNGQTWLTTYQYTILKIKVLKKVLYSDAIEETVLDHKEPFSQKFSQKPSLPYTFIIWRNVFYQKQPFVKQKGSSDVKGSLWNHLDRKVLLWHHEAPLFLRVYELFIQHVWTVLCTFWQVLCICFRTD